MSTYLALTLDPLHIGAGGYRLGRVDNTIVRDAGSGLPKVPGSSLAGVVRYYAGLNLDDGDTCCASDDEIEKGKNGYCGKCTICRIFGYAADSKAGESHIGLLHFYDGHILAMPVRTMAGPVWITCPSALAARGYRLTEKVGDQELVTNFDPPGMDKAKERKLNVGWLYLPYRKGAENMLGFEGELGSAKDLLSRFAIAPDWLFSEIVNSNLEVRTSVRIDPQTGAAQDGALFTYEAIPTATLLAFDIEIDAHRCPQDLPQDKIRGIIGKALACCSTLGMGGMNTRGFGRLSFLNAPEGGK